MSSPYQTSNTPADPKHSSRLGAVQRFYLLEVLSGLKLNDRVVARAAFFVDADRRSQAREQMTWEAP